MRGSIIIDDRVEAEAILGVKRDRGTPTVNIGYPRKGIWSGQNQLGVELPFQLDSNAEQTIFKMDEWGFPEVWTVSLNVSGNGPDNSLSLGPGQAFDVVGEISFGSGGIVQTFKVDWVDGTIFSLPMNAINVRARWSTLATFLGIPPPEDIRISVIVSRGSIRHARATKTDFFNEAALAPGAFAGGGFGFGAIPTFAKSLMVLPFPPGTTATLYSPTTFLCFFTNATNPPAGVNIEIVRIPGSLLGPTASFKVPIPANARYWTFLNGGGAPIAVSGTLVWNLFDE